MRAECGTNILFSRSHQTLKSVINCFDKSSHSKLHPRTTESGGELTRYQPQQQAGEAGVRSSIRRQLRVVTKRCWVPVCEWRTAGPRVYKHARVASVRREAGPQCECHRICQNWRLGWRSPGQWSPVPGLWLVTADPTLASNWWIVGTTRVPIGQNVSGLESK